MEGRKRTIYLDHAATTAVDPRVVEAIALWLETVAERDGLKAERALNNQVYRRLKGDLEREHQGKYVVIAHGALQGVGDTLEQVAGLAPEARHRLVFRVGEAPPRRRERLWQMQRQIETGH